MINAGDARIYTDLQGLAKLKQGARESTPEAIKEVAAQFESIFLSRVLKSMRDAKLAEGILDSDKSDFYRDMYDQQLALHLSGDPGMGLAALIERQLSPPQEAAGQSLSVQDYLKSPLPVRSEKRSEAAVPVNKPVDIKPVDGEKTIQQRFVDKLMPLAKQAARELGVAPGVLVAQAALETGWGKSVIKHDDGRNSFNLFNIKTGKHWSGERANKQTLEFDQGRAHKVNADFRSYPSYQDSFNDYVRLVKNNPRYRHALQQAGHPQRYMQALQNAGYATDPQYADKVMKIYRGAEISAGAAVATAGSAQGVKL